MLNQSVIMFKVLQEFIRFMRRLQQRASGCRVPTSGPSRSAKLHSPSPRRQRNNHAQSCSVERHVTDRLDREYERSERDTERQIRFRLARNSDEHASNTCIPLGLPCVHKPIDLRSERPAPSG